MRVSSLILARSTREMNPKSHQNISFQHAVLSWQYFNVGRYKKRKNHIFSIFVPPDNPGIPDTHFGKEPFPHGIFRSFQSNTPDPPEDPWTPKTQDHLWQESVPNVLFRLLPGYCIAIPQKSLEVPFGQGSPSKGSFGLVHIHNPEVLKPIWKSRETWHPRQSPVPGIPCKSITLHRYDHSEIPVWSEFAFKIPKEPIG